MKRLMPILLLALVTPSARAAAPPVRSTDRIIREVAGTAEFLRSLPKEFATLVRVDPKGRTVTLRLRFDDFSRATRSHTLPRATSQTATVIDSVRALLMDALPMIRERGVTLVGIAMANLDGDDAVQLELPFDELHAPALDAVIDGVRERFGNDAVGRAVLLGRRMGSVPMLPD